MSQRTSVSRSFSAIFSVTMGVLALAHVGCTDDGSGSHSNAGGAGTSGHAGSSGGAAAGAGGGAAGTGGSSSGTAGTAAPSGGAGDGAQAGSGASGTTGAAGTTGAGGSVGSTGAGGSAGTTGAAGTTGTAGTTGAAGTSGRPSGPSAGCTAVVPNEPIGKAVVHNMPVTVAAAYQAQYTARKYYTTMPMNYNPDPAKPYPVVFWGPGCGATGPEGSSFTAGHFTTDILYVQLLSVTGCFQAGKQGTADSPDGPYFDQALAEVSARYCIDKGKVFAAGTSSGAWLSNYLACARGNVIRGVAADSGGLHHDHGTCTGGAAVMEMPGDSTVVQQSGFDIGAGQARDMFIGLNGCSTTPTTMSFGKANNCQVYGNCGSPVVWCNVGGGHQSGNQVIAESAWQFWNTLK
jgi:poly(3-hydroxybutyrate) depolymerase